MRAKAKIKPPKPVRQSTIPITESDKLMNADTYIGPLRKKGRPKTTNPETRPPATQYNAVASGSDPAKAAKEIIVIDGSDSDVPLPTPTSSIFQTTAKPLKPPKPAARKNKSNLNSPFTTDPLVRRVPDQEPSLSNIQVKTEPQEELTLLDLIAYISATSSSEPNAQNAAILAALSTIDSSASEGGSGSNTPHNPALVSALKQLFSVCATAAPENPPPEPTQHHQRTSSSSQDDGIVVLDKENVNPKASQKRVEKDSPNVKFSAQVSAVSSSSNMGVGQGFQHEQHKQRLGPSARSNENLFRTTSLKESVLAAGPERIVRKRTLSDFMDEKENGKNKGKGKERERVEKRDSSRHSQQSQQRTAVNDSLRHYPRLLASDQPRAEQPSNYYRTPLESWTSPARPPRNHSDDQSPEQPKPVDLTSSTPPQTKVPSPRAQRESASSPVRSRHQGGRKKYVIPEWARTGTSTQPRLSEEAQRALEDLEEKKRLERIAARKRLPSMQHKSKGKPMTFKPASSSQQNTQDIAPPKQTLPEGPLAVSNDHPMIAFADISFPFISSRSSSPPPNASIVPRTPKTPTRKRPDPQSTSGRENESLFTPIMGSGSLFGSVHSNYQQTPSLPTVLTSPLGNRKKARVSPMGLSSFIGREPSSWSNVSSSEDTKPYEPEVEDSRDELDCPPSSLPIASSDIDVGEPPPQTSADSTLDGDDNTEPLPIKQHWAGLPPSSPPAPSSPMLLADDLQTDDEMDDIPIATSDSEADADMSARETDNTSPPSESSPYVQGDFANAFTDADFSALFHIDSTSSPQHSSAGAIDAFEQFTNLSSHSDGSMLGEGAGNADTELEAMFKNGLDGIDFTEFWETFKPLVQDSTQTNDLQEDASFGNFFDLGRDDSLASFGEIDHTKLADDMQALLSGCLM